MSFVARLVMLVSVFVIGWVCFEASMKVYVMSQINSSGQPIPTQNQTVVPVPELRNVSGPGGASPLGQQGLNSNETVAGGLAATNRSAVGAAVGVNMTEWVQVPNIAANNHTTGSSESSDHDVSPVIPLWRPFFPNFMDFFAQATGIYEGIPLLPSLYSNARHRRHFHKVQRLVVASLCGFILLFSPLCVAAYGNSLRDIVLLNLDYGRFETFI